MILKVSPWLPVIVQFYVHELATIITVHKVVRNTINIIFSLVCLLHAAVEPEVYEQILHTRGQGDKEEKKKKKKKKKDKDGQKEEKGGMGLQLLFGGKGGNVWQNQEHDSIML